MIPEKSLVVYKNRPALAAGKDGDKIIISLIKAADERGKKEPPQELKVRGKDIELIHPGPVIDDEIFLEEGKNAAANVREVWELLESNSAEGVSGISLKELAELAYNEYSPASAWAAYGLLLDGLYFSGGIDALRARPAAEVEEEEKKRAGKRQEDFERGAFLERVKKRCPDLPGDSRFMQDVEALACGKTAKSKTMKDLGLPETPEDAHALLLDLGFRTPFFNPHPSRFGLSTVSAKIIPDPPRPGERRDLTGLSAFAVDSPWSADPDDAVSFEGAPGGGQTLYVHVADPASSIAADSPAECEACDRGATLYLPEGTSRMIADESLPLFALGLSETSPALTFKIGLDEKGEIGDVEIFPSLVKVRRLSYEQADKLTEGAAAGAAGTDAADAADQAALLAALCALAERNLIRRRERGAVEISLPETHIAVSGGKVSVEPVVPYRSAGMVRECMLLAGEAAGLFVSRRNDASFTAFPYVTQETGDIPGEILPGMAGFYQLRRCMRPRGLSVRPGPHWGLGLDFYSQVTSPLRRYTDLLAHLQIRAILGGGNPLSEDEVSARLGAGEAAAAAVVRAERASRLHWTCVYLSDKKDSRWDAVILEKKGNRWALMIPALALETQVPLRGNFEPNDSVKLTLKSVNIARGEAVFVQV
ncbi:MAG: RNB domain-containing ribonuclease [Treponema sp.]|jgi:exoribonuclease-2|nr:RNB domain-containing ribonuclease [Treponema sp.]